MNRLYMFKHQSMSHLRETDYMEAYFQSECTSVKHTQIYTYSTYAHTHTHSSIYLHIHSTHTTHFRQPVKVKKKILLPVYKPSDYQTK